MMSQDLKEASTLRSQGARRLLIVDDSREGLYALARLLENHGYEVCSAIDGATTAEMLDSGLTFDAILVDLLLPDLDGREVCQMCVNRLEPKPVVALLTGWVEDLDRHELDRWGIDFLFSKPLELQSLLRTLQSTFDARELKAP